MLQLSLTLHKNLLYMLHIQEVRRFGGCSSPGGRGRGQAATRGAENNNNPKCQQV